VGSLHFMTHRGWCRLAVLATRHPIRIIAAVIDLDPADRAMLGDALARARHLVAELEKQQVEIDASPRPAGISAEQYEEGRHAMIKAIASARRMLVSLEEAEHIADGPEEDDDPDADMSKDAADA
jgi:hypothetical protein